MAQILCVSGPVDAAAVTHVLPHEHLFCDLSHLLQPPSLPLTLENLADIQQLPSRCVENLKLDSVEHITAEIARFGDKVPKCLLLDTTSPLQHRNLSLLERLSKAGPGGFSNSVAVVFCTGPWNTNHSTQELADAMARELAVGCEQGGLRAVAIVLPISHRFQVIEQARVIELPQQQVWIDAACIVRQRISTPVIVECGYNIEQTMSIAEKFVQACPTGVSWVVLSEIAPNPENLDVIVGWLQQGFHVCIDSFGSVERPATGPQLPSDEVACGVVCQLCCRGFERQLHLSHNLSRKMQLQRFGGYGLSHIMLAIVPRFRALGCADETVRRLVGGNALELLAYYEPPAEVEIFVAKLTCDVCGKKFPENSPEFFTKFNFVYCGSQCLREHRKSNFGATAESSKKQRA